MKASAKYHDCVHCVIGEKTFTNILTRRAFLKTPENFSGPKTFRGAFRVFFSGPEKCFSEHPKVSRIVSRYFSGIFSCYRLQSGYDNATRAGGKIILEHGFIITTFNFSSWKL